MTLKTAGCYVANFKQAVSKELLKLLLSALTHPTNLIGILCDYVSLCTQCCAGIQLRSQQRVDAAGTIVVLALLFGCY